MPPVTNDAPAPDAGLSDIDEFFEESSEQSRVKTGIVTKYFFAWADVITRKTGSERIAYADLYAGPGRYKDGTKSAPLLVLEGAIAEPSMRQTLVTIFNDADPAHADSLQRAIDSVTGINTLRYRPEIITEKVGPKIVAALQKRLVPTFAFIDPWGYEGLSLGLVNAVIKDWGCECLFFFNYNRINPGISNPAVAHHMAGLFGAERLAALRRAVHGRSPADRERLIMAGLTEAIQGLGGKYVLPFRFRMESGRTSHFLVFVSKEFLGYGIMRDVMAKASSSSVEGVASFEYDPHALVNPPLFELGRSIKNLAEALATDMAGRMLTVRQVFEVHSPGKLYVLRNYKDALLSLEEDARVVTNPAPDERRKRKGKVTLADEVLVMFPREPGQGVRIPASRSTRGRPAADRPPSAWGRPTA